MPIATCFIKDQSVDQERLDKLIRNWAGKIGVDPKDVSLTIIPNCQQFGQQYTVLCKLYLPSLWSPDKIHIIQKELMIELCQAFDIGTEEVFIMTSIIESGHVMENGEIVEWGA